MSLGMKPRVLQYSIVLSDEDRECKSLSEIVQDAWKTCEKTYEVIESKNIYIRESTLTVASIRDAVRRKWTIFVIMKGARCRSAKKQKLLAMSKLTLEQYKAFIAERVIPEVERLYNLNKVEA